MTKVGQHQLPSFTHSTNHQTRIADFLQLIQNHLPQNLKTLTIFEDSNDTLANTLIAAQSPQSPWCQQTSPSRIPNPALSAAFAARSLPLTHLAVSHMITAEAFFPACLAMPPAPSSTWPHLQSLALTSPLLLKPPTQPRRQAIDALLYNAGVAALRMPRLWTLVLWNGTEGDACAFVYQMDRGRGVCCATWRGTWEVELSKRVVGVWERVAWEGGECVLRVGRERVCAGGIGSHGDAVWQLGLPCRVVEAESLWQIRREGGGVDGWGG